jgi:hypothetical protein
MTATATIESLRTLRTTSAAPIEAQLPAVAPGFGSLQSFELMQRAAKLLSNSTLVPSSYRAKDDKKGENPNALANCVVALNMAQRVGADPLMVMQNLYVVEGRPSWSAQWIIAAINGCGRFSPLRFDIEDLGEKEVVYETVRWENRERVVSKNTARVRNLKCVAWAVEKETGERITSPAVSIEMAVREGWYGKNGSKWQTMPEVMLRYRTASFFGRIYAPELLMGLQSVEEIQDTVIEAVPDGQGGYTVDLDSLREGRPTATPREEAPAPEPEKDAAPAAAAPAPADQKQEKKIEQAPAKPAARPAAVAEIARAGGIENAGEWVPTTEEAAAIHAREVAEGKADRNPTPVRSHRDLNME